MSQSAFCQYTAGLIGAFRQGTCSCLNCHVAYGYVDEYRRPFPSLDEYAVEFLIIHVARNRWISVVKETVCQPGLQHGHESATFRLLPSMISELTGWSWVPRSLFVIDGLSADAPCTSRRIPSNLALLKP